MTHEDADDSDESTPELYVHSNWERGQPCPVCGETTMDVVQASTEKYRHADSQTEHIDYGEYRVDLRVECSACQELLLEHPAMDALNAL